MRQERAEVVQLARQAGIRDHEWLEDQYDAIERIVRLAKEAEREVCAVRIRIISFETYGVTLSEHHEAASWLERSNALGEGRERGILREASSGEAATSTDGLGG